MAVPFPGKICQENTVKSNFNQPGDYLASTNGPWAVTPTIRSSSGSERKKMMPIHANLSKILKYKLRLPPWSAQAPGHRPGPCNRGHGPSASTNRPLRIGSGGFSPISRPFRQRCHFPEKSVPRKSKRSRQVVNL